MSNTTITITAISAEEGAKILAYAAQLRDEPDTTAMPVARGDATDHAIYSLIGRENPLKPDEIADVLGISRATVYRRIKGMGITL